MSEVIQGDFVKRRQESVGGEAMTQEDLLFRMGASRWALFSSPDRHVRCGLTLEPFRLLALSHGRSALDEVTWTAMAELDERRKEAVALVKK